MIPEPIRIAKHRVFGFLPGRLGLRNRACYRGLTAGNAREAFRQAVEQLEAGATCIDCGANVGSFTRLLAEKAGKVYAFEPDPWSVGELRRNTAGLDNIEIVQAAVGTEDGQISLYRKPGFESNPEAASVGTSCFDKGGESYIAELRDLAKFIRDLDTPISILKIDVEGAEVAILERLLEDPCLDQLGFVFVETHELLFPELLERTEALRKRVAGLEYPKFDLDWH